VDNLGSAIAVVLTALTVSFFVYRVKKEREKLRSIVGLLGEGDAPLIAAIEELVHGGKLTPIPVRSI
jgi:hypothetical protein